jgi:hypothetical protein
MVTRRLLPCRLYRSSGATVIEELPVYLQDTLDPAVLRSELESEGMRIES